MRAFLWIALALVGPARSPAETMFGMHTTTADLPRLKAWEAWTGAPVPIVGENLFATTWDDFTGTNPEAGIGYTLQKWREAFPEGERKRPQIEFALPMFPDHPQSGAPDYRDLPDRWQKGADGKFNPHFKVLAETLVAQGLGTCHLRLAWEFNLPAKENRYALIGNPETWPLFIAYWRQIHDTMMSVPGAGFVWVWGVIVGNTDVDFLPTRDAWPGDAFVDIISCDIYDSSGIYYWQKYEMPRDQTHDWKDLRQWSWDFVAHGKMRDPYSGEMQPGTYSSLDSYLTFAREHGKRFAISEWGILEGDRFPEDDMWGGNDDPAFIERMHQWILENDIAYCLYFEHYLTSYDYGFVDHSILPGHWNLPGTTPDFIAPYASLHPLSSTRYLQLFHGRTGQAPPATPEPPHPARVVFADSFTDAIGPFWNAPSPWTHRRNSLHVRDAPATVTARADFPLPDSGTLDFTLALPTAGEGFTVRLGPWTVDLQVGHTYRLESVVLRDRSQGIILDRAYPKLPIILSHMRMPFQLAFSGSSELAISLGSIALLAHTAPAPLPKPDGPALEFEAGKKATAYVGSVLVLKTVD